MISYGERLSVAVASRGPLCVGIDPHPEILSGWNLSEDAAGLERCARGMVDALDDVVAVFKPQSAFFEAFGSAGIAVLERTLSDITGTGALALLDIKRGDISSTMAGYAAAYLSDGSPLAADAITLSPYLGFGSLDGVIELALGSGRGVYVLAMTSNPEASMIQRARVEDGRFVGQLIIDEAASRNRGPGIGSVGVVVGATISGPGADFGALNGSILAPGLGAQGATARDLTRIFGEARAHVLPAMSREVMAAGPDPGGLREAVRRLQGEMAGILDVG